MVWVECKCLFIVVWVGIGRFWEVIVGGLFRVFIFRRFVDGIYRKRMMFVLVMA